MRLASIRLSVPEPLRRLVRPLRADLGGAADYVRDALRFRRHHSRDIEHANCAQLSARLMFHAHSIEKGLAHEEIRYQFGANALSALQRTLQHYDAAGCPIDSDARANALSVLRAYLDLHHESGEDSSSVRRQFAQWLPEIAQADTELGGTVTITASSKRRNRDKGFAELFRGRTSVREYADTPVDITLVSEALGIAAKAPSICNRQPYRVRLITDDAEIKRFLEVQGGVRGHSTPPVLLVITTDIRDFVGYNERNQVYVNGGIYAMGLLLALEYVGLAACPLNTMFSRTQEREVRRLVKADHEAFIMAISVGNFRDQVKSPRSFRYQLEDRQLD